MLVSRQAVSPTFYNKIALMEAEISVSASQSWFQLLRTFPLAFICKFIKQVANWSASAWWRFHRPCSCQDDCGIYYECAVLGWNLLSNIFRVKLQ